MSLPREALDQTSTWLLDLVRQGLDREAVKQTAFWHEQSARLVDAKLPGLARRIRRLTMWSADDVSWPAIMLIELGRLHLLLQAALRFAELPEDWQRELTISLRPAPKREILMEQSAPVRDRWIIVGRRVIMEPLGPQQRMRVAETWLLGQATGQLGLHLGFSPERSSRVKSPDGPPAPETPPVEPLGRLLEGTPGETSAHFVSPTLPLRLLFGHAPEFGKSHEVPAELPWLAGFAEVNQALLAAASRLAWLEQFPVLVRGVMPLTEAQAREAGCLSYDAPFPASRWVADSMGNRAPVSPQLPEKVWWRWLAHAQDLGPGNVFAVLDPAPYVLPYTLWEQQGGTARPMWI